VGANGRRAGRGRRADGLFNRELVNTMLHLGVDEVASLDRQHVLRRTAEFRLSCPLKFSGAAPSCRRTGCEAKGWPMRWLSVSTCRARGLS
jgi:hypothetical protein